MQTKKQTSQNTLPTLNTPTKPNNQTTKQPNQNQKKGEYIAVEKLEATYAKAAPVEQVWVYGDSYQPKLVAVVHPKPGALKAWAKGAAAADDYAALCADPAAAKWVLGELIAAAKADKLKGFEMVAAVHLEPDAFSVEADLMTPTFKLKRPQLKKRYQGQIDAMYASLAAA
jgi:long-chain acyl-CoA synthetase